MLAIWYMELRTLISQVGSVGCTISVKLSACLPHHPHCRTQYFCNESLAKMTSVIRAKQLININYLIFNQQITIFMQTKPLLTNSPLQIMHLQNSTQSSSHPTIRSSIESRSAETYEWLPSCLACPLQLEYRRTSQSSTWMMWTTLNWNTCTISFTSSSDYSI